MPTVALRTALVWHDEVMDDVVSEVPRKITVGSSGGTTFTVPNVGLPQDFAIVQPGKRGYLLTLGSKMRGTICIDGNEQSVEEFVAKSGDADSGFTATAIGGRDWGVIELDETGVVKVFFQFVPVEEEAQPFFTRKVIYAGIAGELIAAIALAVVFMLVKDVEFGEGLLRGTLISLIPIAIAGIAWGIIRQNGELQASIAFSVILHAYLLFWTYKLFDPNEDPFQYPGPKSITGQYLITRLEDEPPEEPPKPVASGEKASGMAAPKSPEKPNNAATKGAEGAAGGAGEKERARDKDAKEDAKREAPKVAFFEDKNKKYLDNIIDRNLDFGLDKFKGLKGDVTTPGSIGFGPGQGTGAGPGNGTGTTRGSTGKGPGGGGFSDQDIVRNKGPIDTGKNRPGGNCVGPHCAGNAPKAIEVGMSNPSGDFGGLSAEEIDRVVRSRAGVFRACYQKELNRTPGLGGKLVMKFKIDGNGVVQAASTGGGSTMRNAAVESCVASNVMRLKFPAKGGVANVNYPFVFSQGG